MASLVSGALAGLARVFEIDVYLNIHHWLSPLALLSRPSRHGSRRAESQECQIGSCEGAGALSEVIHHHHPVPLAKQINRPAQVQEVESQAPSLGRKNSKKFVTFLFSGERKREGEKEGVGCLLHTL